MTSAQSTQLLEIPAALVPHIVLPRLELLSEARTRGAECVWGGERLTGETAIDLGKHSDGGFNWFPRACRPCTRAAVRAACRYHPRNCEQCVDNADICDVRRALHELFIGLKR
ncbi:hypothetical protein [Streptomyces eurythermus]|uniref:hypothetical protein n=1 Tax=Streptomyces eurythermus TaxID=42237 RepID=UPI0036D433BE